EAVVVRVVEEVALDAPDFVVHLPPLCARVNLHGQVVQLQSALAGLGRLRRRGDEPLLAATEENLLAVVRNVERGDSVEKAVGLGAASAATFSSSLSGASGDACVLSSTIM